MRTEHTHAGVVADWNKPAVAKSVPGGFPLSPTKQKILWVDDSSSLLSLYQAVFGSLGFEVTATSRPQDALMQAANADVAILDYDMPDMNGAALASLIKESHPALPVILYSGNGSIPDAAHQWVDAICEKGAPREELISTIDRLSSERPSSGRARLGEVSVESCAEYATELNFLPSSSESGACPCATHD
jgi:DNA-binding NtrC family response regulator